MSDHQENIRGQWQTNPEERLATVVDWMTLPEIDLERLAKEILKIMRDELRIERERHGRSWPVG